MVAEPLAGKRFDVEHAIDMFATSYVVMPAFGIYDAAVVAEYKANIATCHIYLIGTLPAIEFVDQRMDGGALVIGLLVGGERRELSWPMPPGAELEETDRGWFVRHEGRYWAPGEAEMMKRLSDEHGAVVFDVLYVGQSFGKDGSRNALDRLLKHETLQRIALTGVPANRRLNVLMLEIEPGNRVITVMNPHAEDTSQGAARIAAGLDKLFGTSEGERVTLYEASLIRYFQPPFNREFKDSFPSTQLKVLADCYDKDFSAVVAEICIEELPFRIGAGAVAPSTSHVARFDLHDDEARRVFFGRNG